MCRRLLGAKAPGIQAIFPSLPAGARHELSAGRTVVPWRNAQSFFWAKAKDRKTEDTFSPLRHQNTEVRPTDPLQREGALAETVDSSHAGPSAAQAESSSVSRGTMIGQYEIEGELGRGGMGEVFAAVHPLIGKRVAIKVIRRDKASTTGAVERFLQEARAVNLIRHPNIVDIFAFGSLPDGRPYLAMDLLIGQTLRERLQHRSLLLWEICHVGEAISRALQAAHSESIVHRDLKPENVFLVDVPGELPQIKLLDFGLAKLLDRVDLRADATESGALLGTPRYLAPEQASGGAIDARADLYALGAMLFEMCTGQPPFLGNNAIELMAHHLSSPPPRPSSLAPEVPAALDDLIVELLAKAPEDRPGLATVREVLAESRLAPSEPSPAPRRWRFHIAAAAFVAAVALSAAAVTWLGEEDGGSEPSAAADEAAASERSAGATPPPAPALAPAKELAAPAATASGGVAPAPDRSEPPPREEKDAPSTRPRRSLPEAGAKGGNCPAGDPTCKAPAPARAIVGTGVADDSIRRGVKSRPRPPTPEPVPAAAAPREPAHQDDELIDVYEEIGEPTP